MWVRVSVWVLARKTEILFKKYIVFIGKNFNQTHYLTFHLSLVKAFHWFFVFIYFAIQNPSARTLCIDNTNWQDEKKRCWIVPFKVQKKVCNKNKITCFSKMHKRIFESSLKARFTWYRHKYKFKYREKFKNIWKEIVICRIWKFVFLSYLYFAEVNIGRNLFLR